MEIHGKRPNSDQEQEPPYVIFAQPQTQVPEFYNFEGSQFLIGRGLDVDLQIISQKVSRTHCKIVQEPGNSQWMLIDESTLGTYLNYEKVVKGTPCLLKHGDVLCISGPYSFPVYFHTTGHHLLSKKRRSDDDDSVVELTIPDTDRATYSQHSVPENGGKTSASQQPPYGNYSASCSTQTDPFSQNLSPIELKALSTDSHRGNSHGEVSEEKDDDAFPKSNEELQTALSVKSKELADYKIHSDALEYRLKLNRELIDNLKFESIDLKKKLEDSKRNSNEALLLKASKDLTDTIESELQCCICNELVYNATIVLPCSHIFCKFCIDTWAKRKKECAVCRTPITKFVPCRLIDSLIEKIVEKLPDKEFCERRKQFITERINADAAASANHRSINVTGNRGRRFGVSARRRGGAEGGFLQTAFNILAATTDQLEHNMRHFSHEITTNDYNMLVYGVDESPEQHQRRLVHGNVIATVDLTTTPLARRRAPR